MLLYLIWNLVKTSQRNYLSETIHSALLRRPGYRPCSIFCRRLVLSVVEKVSRVHSIGNSLDRLSTTIWAGVGQVNWAHDLHRSLNWWDPGGSQCTSNSPFSRPLLSRKLQLISLLCIHPDFKTWSQGPEVFRVNKWITYLEKCLYLSLSTIN